MSKLELRRILKKVRKGLEEFAMSDDSKPFYFNNDPFLAGACAIGSFVLKEELWSLGFNSNVVYCLYKIRGEEGPYGHCYVERDGLILDVTISQFMLSRKILIAGQGDRGYSRYQMPIIHNNIHSDFEYWDEDQRPTIDVINFIRDKYII